MSTPALAPAPSVTATPLQFQRSDREIAIVFSTVLLVVWMLAGNTFVFASDEAIYLEGARSVLDGKVLYKDLFAFTGPGTYWLLTLCYQIFGVTIAAGRIPFLLTIAMTTTFVYWFVARFVGRQPAAFASFLCLAIELSDVNMQNVNHRWDSTGFACLAIMLACRRDAGRWVAALSGVCAAAAAWCSPTVLYVGVVLAVWHWRRKSISSYLAGAAACSALSVVILAATGSLPYLLPRLLWASQNYGRVNRVPYGYVIGGLGKVFNSGDVSYLVVAGVVYSAILAPAICPVLNLAAARQILRGPATVVVVAACSLGLVASTHPRSDIGHLTFVMAPTLAVSTWVLAQWKIGRYIGQVVGIGAAMLMGHSVYASLGTQSVNTPTYGVLRAEPRQRQLLAMAHKAIPPGSSLFVYPYMPMLYFITGAVNPTPYSFLFPGMMTPEDERAVVSSLEQSPPQYVMFCLYRAEDRLRIWPNLNVNEIRMKEIEGWIEEHYAPDASGLKIDGYTLYRRRSPHKIQKAPRVSGAL